MGEAMIKGLLNPGLTSADRIVVSDPWVERLDFLRTTYCIETTADNAEAVRGADIVVLSIKPQSLTKVGKDLHSRIFPDALVLSIIAGTRISTLQNQLFHDRIVRAMPNTPGQLGQGHDGLDGHAAVHAGAAFAHGHDPGGHGRAAPGRRRRLPGHGDRD